MERRSREQQIGTLVATSPTFATIYEPFSLVSDPIRANNSFAVPGRAVTYFSSNPAQLLLAREAALGLEEPSSSYPSRRAADESENLFATEDDSLEEWVAELDKAFEAIAWG